MTDSANIETGALRCCTCKAWKSPDDFFMATRDRRQYPCFQARSGRDYQCKACNSASRMASYYRYHDHNLMNKKRRRCGLPLLPNYQKAAFAGID